MKVCPLGILGAVALFAAALTARAEVKTVVDHNTGADATADFTFKHVPSPSDSDAATTATFSVIDGEGDEPSGGLSVLHDGKTSSHADDPEANFFFAAGSPGGRLRVDLGEVRPIAQVNTYSWHRDTRGPQVYKLYAADGKAKNFDAKPESGVDPATAGWTFITSVDTRAKESEAGGQYGVSTAGPIGKYRFLLFDIARTESHDAFGNTFYTEIDVVAVGDKIASGKPSGTGTAGEKAVAGKKTGVAKAGNGKFDITIDTSETPELTDWADTKLRPVVDEWYPIIVAMLPSDRYTAPASFSITFRKDKRGVADTGGTRVNCAADWFKKNLDGEAKGAVVHELVHVVQQYRTVRGGTRNPGWIVEGVADYIRWFKYEPQSARPRPSAAKANYDDSYRTTAAFLDYVTRKYDKDLVPSLNAAMRSGKYSEDLWMQKTGKSVEDLGTEWKESLRKR